MYAKDTASEVDLIFTNLLSPKPKSTFRHLQHGIKEFHGKYVLVPGDKAADNVVVV